MEQIILVWLVLNILLGFVEPSFVWFGFDAE